MFDILRKHKFEQQLVSIKQRIYNNKEYVYTNMASVFVLFLNLVVLIFSTRYLVGKLGVSQYGIWIFLMNITNYLTLSHLGYTSTLTSKFINFNKDESAKNKFLTAYIIWVIILASAGCIAGYFIINGTASHQNSSLIQGSSTYLTILAAFLLNFMSLFIEVLLHVYHNMNRYRLFLELIRGGVMSSIYCAGIYFYDINLAGLSIIFFGISALLFVLNTTLFIQKTTLKLNFSLEYLKIILSYFKSSLYYLVLSISGIMLNQFDSLYIMNILQKPELVVLYSQSYRINDFWGKIIKKFAENKASKIVKLYGEKKFDEIAKLSRKLEKLAFWASVPVSIFLVTLAKPILEIWLKHEIEFDRGLLAIFSLLLMINSVYWTKWFIYNIIEQQHKLVWISLIEILLNVSLSLILISKLQLIGIAIASLISNAISLFSFYIFAKIPKNQ